MTPLDTRLRYWAQTRPCIWRKCYRDAAAITSKGGFEAYCGDHAAIDSPVLTKRGEPLLSLETGEEWTP